LLGSSDLLLANCAHLDESDHADTAAGSDVVNDAGTG
jgi:hypothetical protein